MTNDDFHQHVEKMVERRVKDISKYTNDDMANHIDFWVGLNGELTDGQVKFFTEVAWRLRLMSDKENTNG